MSILEQEEEEAERKNLYLQILSREGYARVARHSNRPVFDADASDCLEKEFEEGEGELHTELEYLWEALTEFYSDHQTTGMPSSKEVAAALPVEYREEAAEAINRIR